MWKEEINDSSYYEFMFLQRKFFAISVNQTDSLCWDFPAASRIRLVRNERRMKFKKQ